MNRRPPTTWNSYGYGLRAENGTVRGSLGLYPAHRPVSGAAYLDQLLRTAAPEQGRPLGSLLLDNMYDLYVEPGRALLDQCGMVLARVLEVRDTDDGDTVLRLDLNARDVSIEEHGVLMDPVVATKQRRAAAPRPSRAAIRPVRSRAGRGVRRGRRAAGLGPDDGGCAGDPSRIGAAAAWPDAERASITGELSDGSAFVPGHLLDTRTAVGTAASPDGARCAWSCAASTNRRESSGACRRTAVRPLHRMAEHAQSRPMTPNDVPRCCATCTCAWRSSRGCATPTATSPASSGPYPSEPSPDGRGRAGVLDGCRHPAAADAPLSGLIENDYRYRDARPKGMRPWTYRCICNHGWRAGCVTCSHSRRCCTTSSQPSGHH